MLLYQYIKSLLEMLLFLFSIIGIFLLGGQWVLQQHFNDLAASGDHITRKYGATNKEILRINEILTETSAIQKDFILFTPKVTEFFNVIPPGISLSTTNMDYRKNEIILSGTANTRDSYLELQQNILALPYVEAADIPPAQLTQKENISFSLKVLLKEKL